MEGVSTKSRENGKNQIQYSQGEKKGINSQPIKRQRMSDTFAHRYHGWDNRANGKGFEKPVQSEY